MTIGIDEAGRGAWAGPFIAVALALDQPIPGLNDSKQLTPARRSKLFADIQRYAYAIGVGWISPRDIDSNGLTWAQEKAMSRALDQIDSPAVEQVILDGSVNYLPADPRVQTIVKADAKYPEVMAASIIAKVLRDKYMQALDLQHPGFELAGHKGYGTKKHSDALRLRTPLAGLHRFSYKPVAARINS